MAVPPMTEKEARALLSQLTLEEKQKLNRLLIQLEHARREKGKPRQKGKCYD